MPSRRRFLLTTASAAALPWTSLFAQTPPARAFTLNLVCGMIGVGAKAQADINRFAASHGFESVEARADEIAKMSPDEIARLKDDLAAKRLVWGASFLPNTTRVDAVTHEEGLKALPAIAAGLRRAGVTRMGTWISPASDTLTYLQNFKQHVERVRAIGRILDGEGVRFGLEYIGTPTLRRKRRHSFIHSMAETKELLAEVNVPSVGFVLDSWHWFTAGEGEAEIRSLTSDRIVAVDMNDAPAGVALEDQIDGRRELPAATGVIDIAAFVRGLIAIGYSGPARAEPFNAALNAMDDDAACAATMAALKQAVSRGAA